MSTYIPHTPKDYEEMLSFLGIESIQDLFSDIPGEIRETEPMGIPGGISEYEALQIIKELAGKNRTELVSFMGCGSYDHIIPAAVGGLISRGEFLTAYTPYQAEISQGILQAIYEFQSMICELTGLDVSNASLYDGHTAAVEAAVIALNSGAKKDTILYSATLHPHTIEVLRAYFEDLPVILEEIPETSGAADLNALYARLDERVGGVILQTPNIYGILEDYSGLAEKLTDFRSLLIISSNPVSLGLMKTPGEWGAHIGIGDLQSFGLPCCYGGPSVGYIAASSKYLRKLPGRISGRSVDSQGKPAFVLTLQAREQHIKRERASSNICSNQALAAVACTIHMSLIGRKGLIDAARQSASKAHYLQKKIKSDLGLGLLHDEDFFNEFTLELPCDAEALVREMADDAGYSAGVDLGRLRRKALDNQLTIAVTEKRTRAQLDGFTESLGRCIGRLHGGDQG